MEARCPAAARPRLPGSGRETGRGRAFPNSRRPRSREVGHDSGPWSWGVWRPPTGQGQSHSCVGAPWGTGSGLGPGHQPEGVGGRAGGVPLGAEFSRHKLSVCRPPFPAPWQRLACPELSRRLPFWGRNWSVALLGALGCPGHQPARPPHCHPPLQAASCPEGDVCCWCKVPNPGNWGPQGIRSPPGSPPDTDRGCDCPG